MVSGYFMPEKDHSEYDKTLDELYRITNPNEWQQEKMMEGFKHLKKENENLKNEIKNSWKNPIGILIGIGIGVVAGIITS